MNAVSFESIQAYRRQTFRLADNLRLHSKEQAIDFVNQRGFVFFWPINNVTLPSLWAAVAGDRPVADNHDDPGHVTWGWKDGLLGKRRWYYAKVLRKRATMISLETAPYFYALSENYGSPEEDYLTLYEQGRLTIEEKVIYEALLEKGPLDTVALRKEARLTSRESDHRFNRALADLQADFKVLPVAVTEAGAWHYAFAYETVARHFPELPDQAHNIRESEARQKLAELYFRSVGAAQPRDLVRLFGWNALQVERTLGKLVQAGLLRGGLEVAGHKGEWFILAELCP
ncbi:MAG TPA: crosslink repair DNA glycosylase YcaQ family protein [Anaerolineales bacterium]